MRNGRSCGIALTLLLAMLSAAAGMAQPSTATTVEIHADRAGATINKNVYAQFSEHLKSPDSR